jgi:hypothetical protein
MDSGEALKERRKSFANKWKKQENRQVDEQERDWFRNQKRII